MVDTVKTAVDRCSKGADPSKVVAELAIEKDMTTLYRESELIAELNRDEIPEDCYKCPKAHLCRGGAKCLTYAVTGNMHGKDINCYL